MAFWCCAAEPDKGVAVVAAVDPPPAPPKNEEPKPEPVIPAAPPPAPVKEEPPKVEEKAAPAPPAPAASAEFTISITDSPAGTSGLRVDGLDGEKLIVVSIDAGSAFDTYNKSASEDKKIKELDYIMEVNGKKGNSKAMEDTLAEQQKLDCLVKRASEFPVNISKAGGSLGVDLTCKEKWNSLLIKKITDGGFSKWNSANPGKEIKSNDRIVAVGGKRGTAADMLATMKSESDMEITISRPS